MNKILLDHNISYNFNWFDLLNAKTKNNNKRLLFIWT